MEARKFVVAVVVGYLILLGMNVVVHGMWLRSEYLQRASLWRPVDALQSKMWAMWIGLLIFTVVFTWVYTRGVEAKPWVGQGLRYGVVMSLLVVVPAVSSEYVVFPVPYTLALKWMIAGAIELVVLGLVVAAIRKKPAA